MAKKTSKKEGRGASFFSSLYTFALLLFFVLILPLSFYQWIRYGKYRASWEERLGIKGNSYERKEGPLVWFHACSVGEVRAVATLAKRWHEERPEWQIVFSTTTETGFAEAKRSAPFASFHTYLPLDFPWVMRPLIKKVHPDCVVCTESDFWYHFLSQAKHEGAQIVLVNGKISQRSARLFQIVPFFARRIFALFDCCCVQNETYAERFRELGVSDDKIHVTPNLKYDAPIDKPRDEEIAQWKKEWGIESDEKIITIGSTHSPEEKLFLPFIQQRLQENPKTKIFLVPRHTERVKEIESLLQEANISYKKGSESNKTAPVILMDAMGQLNRCYAMSDLALVGGSFAPGVGGHNILEPCFVGVPVLFGPYMETQEEMVSYVLRYQAGKQVPIEKLEETMCSLQQPASHHFMGAQGLQLKRDLQGSIEQTLQFIQLTRWRP